MFRLLEIRYGEVFWCAEHELPPCSILGLMVSLKRRVKWVYLTEIRIRSPSPNTHQQFSLCPRILFSGPLKLSGNHPRVPKLKMEVLVSQKYKVYFEKKCHQMGCPINQTDYPATIQIIYTTDWLSRQPDPSD